MYTLSESFLQQGHKFGVFVSHHPPDPKKFDPLVLPAINPQYVLER